MTSLFKTSQNSSTINNLGQAHTSVNMSNNSKKHHYLPQFYLRGFADENGFFTIYDKELKIFRRSKPEHEFYEKNKNSIDINGEKSLIIEQAYSHLESVLAPVLVAVEKSKHDEHILNSDLIVRLIFFIETIRWRNPALDSLFHNIIQRFKFEDFGFKLNVKNEVDKERIQKEILQHHTVQKILRPLMGALAMSEITSRKHDISKWRILYQEGGFPIIGDFPIIFNPISVSDRSNQELILPLSANRTIMYSNSEVTGRLPDTFIIDKDLAIMHLSRRFICCKREDYLRFMVNLYYLNEKDLNDKFFEGIFNSI